MKYRIITPVEKEIIKELRAGDSVFLSGIIYTARDQAHKRIADALNEGKELPFDLNNSAIYYSGPTPEHDDFIIGSCGPTTSSRMDKFSPLLMDHGNLVMIGKGQRNKAVRDAIIRNGAVYLGAAGGLGAMMAACVKKAEIIAYPDLGCEAVRRLVVEDMPLTVIIDSEGNDLYEIGPAEYLRSIDI